jgi:murein L,D-transpeptidase YcbB/YkuD
MGERYILVNIADFRLKAVEKGELARTMKTIIGSPERQTPLFKEEITYLVLNPYWNIPRQIAVQDILPKVKKNPNYLKEQKIKVFSNWPGNSKPIDYDEIEWSELNPGNFDYYLRQEPGTINSLGRVKFMFPNPYNIYLHDTSNQSLFANSFRAFSSGCVRVEKPVELAHYLLKEEQGWDEKKIVEIISQQTRRVVELSEPIPVYIVYLTAWVDKAGIVQFRNDIYGRDKVK